MLPILRNSLFNLTQKVACSGRVLVNSFHIFSRPQAVAAAKPSLLSVVTANLVPNCGFKVVGKVKRRCKDCYLVWKFNRLHNLCKTHPRHKQMALVKKERNTWILTHATQSKKRPW